MDEIKMEELNEEQHLMSMISQAGGAKSSAYEALAAAEEDNHEEAEQLLKEARSQLVEAHRLQTGLIAADAEGRRPEHFVLTIHAMDLTMSAASEIELIEHFIAILRKGDRR